MRLRTLIISFALLVGGGLVVTLWLRHRNTRLRHEVGLAHASAPRAVALPSTAPGAAPPPTIADQISAARRELAELEAREARSTASPPPELVPPGLTRLEDLRDAGQQTPGAAVQTLLWASFHGDDRTLANALLLEPGARTKAADFLAALPESVRQKLPTPESFAALFLSEGLTNVTAVRIGDATAIDPENATVRVEGIMGRDLQLPTRRSASGWQIVVGEKQIEWAIARLRATPAK